MRISLVPDYIFDTFDMASADFLAQNGISGIILDVDNTLEPYENALPGKTVVDWLESLKRKGIRAAIVSNNNAKRISKFNENLNLPAYSNAAKPFKKNVLRAMEDIGTDTSTTALMGDQIFTDVWAARNAGIRAILVKPIKDLKDPFTKLKRLFEKGIINKYEKEKK